MLKPIRYEDMINDNQGFNSVYMMLILGGDQRTIRQLVV